MSVQIVMRFMMRRQDLVTSVVAFIWCNISRWATNNLRIITNRNYKHRNSNLRFRFFRWRDFKCTREFLGRSAVVISAISPLSGTDPAFFINPLYIRFRSFFCPCKDGLVWSIRSKSFCSFALGAPLTGIGSAMILSPSSRLIFSAGSPAKLAKLLPSVMSLLLRC